MSKRKPGNDASLSPPLLMFVRLLLAAALLISLYLGYVSFGGGNVAGCGPDSGCDKVLQSRWSKWFGLPISLPAVLLYGLLFAATLRLSPQCAPEQQRRAWSVLLLGAWAVIGAVVWFASLQIGVIKAICPFCMASHACGLLAALLLRINAPLRQPPEKPWQREKEVYVAPALSRRLAELGLAAVGVLVAGQMLYRPASYNVTNVGDAGFQGAATNRIFQIYEGRFAFQMGEAPLIGKPAAPNAIVSLFDYTCHYCRIMHATLREVQKTFSNQLAIVSLPMPLDSQCNRHVRITPRMHTNACEYARLGLAVWRIDRNVHHQFDDWLFEPEHPPDIEVARDRAAQLVGRTEMEREMTNQWVNQYLQLGMDLYATNYIHVRQGSMPQLIIGTNLITGTNTVDELYRRLDNQLGLSRSNVILKAK